MTDQLTSGGTVTALRLVQPRFDELTSELGWSGRASSRGAFEASLEHRGDANRQASRKAPLLVGGNLGRTPRKLSLGPAVGGTREIDERGYAR
jgi:hypothetical protein